LPFPQKIFSGTFRAKIGLLEKNQITLLLESSMNIVTKQFKGPEKGLFSLLELRKQACSLASSVETSLEASFDC